MPRPTAYDRRSFLEAAATGVFAAQLSLDGTVRASVAAAGRSERTLAPIERIGAGVLDAGYHEAGPSDGPPVLLLHGFPYSIDSYDAVVPMLAARGCRVIVPRRR